MAHTRLHVTIAGIRSLYSAATHISGKEKCQMKRTIATLLAIGILLIVTASPIFAGGDQVRGDKGQGAVTQVQVQNPPPFQP